MCIYYRNSMVIHHSVLKYSCIISQLLKYFNAYRRFGFLAK